MKFELLDEILYYMMVPPALIVSSAHPFRPKPAKADSGLPAITLWVLALQEKSPPLDLHYGLYILTIYGVCNLCAKLGGERQFGLNGLSFYVFNLKFGFLVIKFFSLRISMERWGLLSQVFQRIYLLVCGS